ncbi:class I SAM-dependent methyltransferase [Glycomyces buryatensis]|uniref:Class I SAM-dependent methyltransferase n=1 Tax=Glycomyces buryatensis TaxID=2570927 RepID=A0A4S8PR30_9ACTN|nr:class I SAM-dependent methyltransferase [Glycomyces buryatensis]THV33618.1 class I SAM-dependent methyltransferase [Glycomyces buryatensis]
MTTGTQRENVRSNYQDSQNLKDRISLYRYRDPEIDPVDVALRLLPSDLRFVLDVGCGHGQYIGGLRGAHPEATVVGIDASPAMLAEVEPPIMAADAQAIPYPNDAADAVLAMHMLYHVPDIAKAVGEFRRVLKPGGTLLASTNIEGDMAEVWELWSEATAEVLGNEGYQHGTELMRFDSANATGYLEAEFDSVERFDERGKVAVPAPGPILNYFASARSFVPYDDATHDAIMDAAARRLEAHFERHDRFEFDKVLVFYRCH